MLGNLKRTKFAHFLCMKSSCKSKSHNLQKNHVIMTFNTMLHGGQQKTTIGMMHLWDMSHMPIGLLTKPPWSLLLEPERDGFCNIHVTASYSSPSRRRVVHTKFYWLTKVFSNSAASIEHISDSSHSQRPHFWNSFIFSTGI